MLRTTSMALLITGALSGAALSDVVAVGGEITDYTVVHDADGMVSAAVVDPTMDPFYVVETATENGGAYTIYNNTSNLRLVGFGVSTPYKESTPLVNGWGGGFITYSNGLENNYWEAWKYDSYDWSTDEFADSGLTAADLFGDMGVALGGDMYINVYDSIDAYDFADPNGVSASGFGFINALPASKLLGYAEDVNTGAGYGFAGTARYSDDDVDPVPLPAAGWLLIAGLGAMGALRRRG